MIYTGIHIADIHFGALDSEELYNQLDNIFLKYIDEQPLIHFICIDGDLINNKLSMNSKHAYMLMRFISELAERARARDIKIRIVKGTDSHDNKQLELLHSILDDIDYKIINTVEVEQMFDDFKVLYLPEEYMENMDEYYGEYFSQEYNMICGHGMVTEASFHAMQQESEITHKSAPIYDTKKLLEICKGPIFFGHIHKSQVIRKRFIYVGSFTRWCFGEEEDKGFYIVAIDTENDTYVAEFIQNTDAQLYNTVTIKEDSSLFAEKDVVKQLEFIRDIIVGIDDDYLRIKIQIPEYYEEPELLTYSINTTFSKYKNVKFKIINNNKMRAVEQASDKINMLLDKYGFLFEKSISFEEKIFRFIREKYNKDIPIDRLQDYLYNKLNK